MLKNIDKVKTYQYNISDYALLEGWKTLDLNSWFSKIAYDTMYTHFDQFKSTLLERAFQVSTRWDPHKGKNVCHEGLILWAIDPIKMH